MDFSKLRFGEVVAAASAVALFVFMFFSWYGVKVDFGGGPGGEIAKSIVKSSGVDTTVSAWKAFDTTDLFLLLVVIVAIGLAVLTAAQVSVALPVTASVVTTALGALATLLVLYRILNQPGPNDLIEVKIGAYLGLVACAGIAIGGWQSMREEGTTFEGAAAQASAAVGGGDKGPQTPPPAPPAGEAPSEPPPSGPPPTAS